MDDSAKTDTAKHSLGAIGAAEKIKLRRRYPTIAYLRRRARRQVPRFAFEYLDGGAGADGGIARNWRALDAIELIPRYGRTTALPATAIELFGRRYAAPIGIAPIAGDGRGVHDVTAVAQMSGDLAPARAVVPSAVDEHECQHGKIGGDRLPHFLFRHARA